jgi:hypothetical protein
MKSYTNHSAFLGAIGNRSYATAIRAGIRFLIRFSHLLTPQNESATLKTLKQPTLEVRQWPSMTSS